MLLLCFFLNSFHRISLVLYIFLVLCVCVCTHLVLGNGGYYCNRERYWMVKAINYIAKGKRPTR
jgi:hypothetical protein